MLSLEIGLRVNIFYRKNEQQSLIKIVGEPLDTTKYAVAVMPKNKELLTLFNQAISQIKKDGTYEKDREKVVRGIYPAKYSTATQNAAVFGNWSYSYLYCDFSHLMVES
ncbi:transporter substrate-binding domain-containing protein [Peribacillus frigoritolerans]|nr:transporter substrate-binding domain-containing protein [Peribacillus frigoritolerans]